MKMSDVKNKLMTNSANGIQREMKVKGQKLGTVTSFKYIGAIVPDGGSLKDCTSHYSSDKAEANIEISCIKGETDALFCHIHISVWFCVSDTDGRARYRNADL